MIDVIWTAAGTASGMEGTFSVFQPSVPVDAGSITVKGALRRDVVQSTRVAGIPDVRAADMSYWVRGAYGRVQDGEIQYEVPVNEGAAVIVQPMHDLTGLGHSRGYGPIVAGVEGGAYDAGEVGDVMGLEYGFDDVVQ